MADFLLVLGKLNVAMGAAIILVYVLRRPLRALFGASIAYAIWLLVPIAVLATLLPPRAVAPQLAHLTRVEFTATPMSAIGQIARPALRISEELAGHSAALVHPLVAARDTASNYKAPDYAALLFVAWILGAVLMAVYLARLQARFHSAVRLGEAGPAVLGFFHPRIVIPGTFQEQFTAPEQAAILAHERMHLARQDARVNALAALLRCLCWFNPLVHLGTGWLRIDQELACDAAVVAGPVSRRDYANALVKSQMIVTHLPVGCNWPGSQHPLIERIALLKRKRPATARRITGTGLVMLAVTSAGMGAWAAQPPVTTKFIAEPQPGNQIASVGAVAPNQDTGNIGPSLPVAGANPAGGNAAPSSLHGSRPLPVESPPAPQRVASNDPPAAPAQPQPNTSAAAIAAPNDQSGTSNQGGTMLKQTLAASVALLGLNSTVAAQTIAARTLPSSPSSLETVFIYNTNPAKECYKSAQAGADLVFGLEHCDVAVQDPLIDFRAQTLVNRGIIRFDLGDKSGALQDFAVAISYDPTLGDAYLNQALVLVAAKRPQEAMDAINKGIAMGATNLQLAYYTRAEIEDDAGRYAQAYRDYKEALTIKPGFEPAVRQLERFKLQPKAGDTN